MSVGHILEGQIAMVEEVVDNEAMIDWVCQGIPGEELKNWKFVEIQEVFPFKK